MDGGADRERRVFEKNVRSRKVKKVKGGMRVKIDTDRHNMRCVGFLRSCLGFFD